MFRHCAISTFRPLFSQAHKLGMRCACKFRYYVAVLTLIVYVITSAHVAYGEGTALFIDGFKVPMDQSSKSLSSFILHYNKLDKASEFLSDVGMSIPSGVVAGAYWLGEDSHKLYYLQRDGSKYSWRNLSLDSQGKIGSDSSNVELPMGCSRVCSVSGNYAVGCDDMDRTLCLLRINRPGKLEILSKCKLSSSGFANYQSSLGAIVVSGDFRTIYVIENFHQGAPSYKTASWLHIVNVSADHILHESTKDGLRYDAWSKLSVDYLDNVCYVEKSDVVTSFQDGYPLNPVPLTSNILEYRIRSNGLLAPMLLPASANDFTRPTGSRQNLREIYPEQGQSYYPIVVNSMLVCDRLHVLVGCGGYLVGELYVWAIGKSGITRLLGRYHIEDGELKNGPVRIGSSKSSDIDSNHLGAYFDFFDERLYVIRENFRSRSQDIFSMRLSNDGSLTPLPDDIALDPGAHITNMVFCHY